MVISSSSTNTTVSTLNVLFLTLNKALPGGRPRIARVSLMVRLIFSLNKFQGSLVLKTGNRQSHYFISTFSFECSTRYKFKCGGDLSRPSLPYILEISHICIAQHRLHQHDKGQGNSTKFSQAPLVWLSNHCLDPHPLQERWFVHILPLNSI